MNRTIDSSSVARDPAVQHRITVLVVEDDPMVRNLLITILNLHGYKTLQAEDGAEALELSRSPRGGHISVLITDMCLSQMSGIALAATLRAARPDLKSIFISGLRREDITELSGDMSQAAFVAKPFNGGQIEAALRKLIQCRPARRRIEPSETRPPAPAARAQRRRTATFTSAPRLTKKQPKPSGGVRARRRRKPLRIAAGR